MHPSINKMCSQYFADNDIVPYKISAWYFCDNQVDANICAELVLRGIKRATTTSLIWFQKKRVPLPAPGDLNLVTDWSGTAKCIIQTKHVAIIPFDKVTSEYAEIEGEGDKSLEYWRDVHWQYYKRELKEFGISPAEDMLVVCEIFDVVYANSELRK